MQAVSTEPGATEPLTGASARAERIATTLNWAVLGIFAVLAVGGPLLGRGVFLATEIMGDYSPWQPVLEDQVAAPNPFIGDTIDSVAPLTTYIVDSVKAGDLPEWSPYGMGGFEVAGLPNSGSYSPLSLPWWVVPPTYAPGLVKLLEIAVVTLGMSLFLRRLGLPQATWPLAALIFTASGFMVTWTNWPQTRVAAFLPLLFWAVDRAVGRARLRDSVAIGAVLAAMVLGGFPAVTIYSGFAVGAWGLFRALQQHRGSPGRLTGSLAVCGLGVVLGVLLSAVMLLPFALNSMSVIDLESRSTRGAHLPLQFLASMFYPEIAGGVQVGALTLNPVEGISYVGIVALIMVSLLPLARAWYPGQTGVVLFFGIGLGLLIAAMYFGGPALDLLQKLPTIATSFIGRLRVLAGFFVAVLAAYGFGLLLQGRAAFAIFGTERRIPSTVLRIVAFGAINAAAAVASFYAWRLVPANLRYRLVPEVVGLSAVAAVVAAAILLALLLPRSVVALTAATVAVAGGLAVPALVLARAWWPPSSQESFYAQTGTADFLAESLGPDRYETVGGTMLPGTNLSYRLSSLGGRSFATAEWRALLTTVDEKYFLTPTYARLSPQAAPGTGRNPVLNRFGVRYLVQTGTEVPYGAAPSALDRRAENRPAVSGEVLATAAGAGSGPLRGIIIRVADEPVRDLTVGVRILAADGRELLTTSAWKRTAAGELPVAVAGEGIPTGERWTLEVVLSSPDAATIGVATAPGGGLWAAVVPPLDDGMRVVATGDATVYERLGAGPRVRWADRAIVETDPARRLELLAAGDVGETTVLLERPEDDRPGSAGGAAVLTEVASDDIDRSSFQIDAQGPGWVVVGDSLRRPGWSASVDGGAAEIVPADHAAGAVYIPAGAQTLDMVYQTPGLRQGALVSAGTAMLILFGWAFGVLVDKRRRAPQAPEGAEGAQWGALRP